MDLERATELTKALGVAVPLRPPAPVQHSAFPTWRLSTADGDYLVKRLWRGPDPVWRWQREQGMDLERAAATAGVSLARPVLPPRPAFGFAVRLGQDLLHAHEWVTADPTQRGQLTQWLPRTLAVVHRLRPVVPSEEPLWWGLEDERTWLTWAQEASTRRLSWAAPLLDALPLLADLTLRLRGLWWRAGDHVLSHADVEPQNVLLGPEGPVLVDWDSTAPESATLEVGRTAIAFTSGDPLRVREFFRAYREAGGHLVDVGDDLLLRPVAATLGRLTERIRARLGEAPTPAWVNASVADEAILLRVSRLPDVVRQLASLSRRLQI